MCISENKIDGNYIATSNNHIKHEHINLKLIVAKNSFLLPQETIQERDLNSPIPRRDQVTLLSYAYGTNKNPQNYAETYTSIILNSADTSHSRLTTYPSPFPPSISTKNDKPQDNRVYPNPTSLHSLLTIYQNIPTPGLTNSLLPLPPTKLNPAPPPKKQNTRPRDTTSLHSQVLYS